MHEYLRAEGHHIDIRTTQRDLDRLSADFPLACEQDGRTNYWQWGKGAHALEIPSMAPSTALVFQLVDRYLRPLLPDSTLDLIGPYFGRAREILTTQFRNWHKNVRMVQRGPILIPPHVEEEVQRVVYSALLEGLQFTVYYRARETNDPVEYTVNPIAMVIRDGITYLIATLWDYDDIRHLALHRMDFATLLDRSAKRQDDFDLNQYIENEAAFAYPVSRKHLKLKARFENGAAWHLHESRLSKDQELKRDGSDHTIVTATVPDSSEIRWWLLGFGDQVKVLGPKRLREEFANTAANLARLYR
jgi:hypothetical protein